MTQEPSATGVDDVTLAAGRRVAELRKARGMSQVDLGRAMTDRGVRWSRTSVAKLEGGRRASITAQELLGLAMVFDLPPIMLLADPRAQEQVPVTDGATVHVWDALLWLAGAEPLDQAERPQGGAYSQASTLIEAGQEVARAVRALDTRAAPPSGASDEEADRFRAREDDRHRDAIALASHALMKIDMLGAPTPTFVDLDVLQRRADQLGERVWRPGASGRERG